MGIGEMGRHWSTKEERKSINLAGEAKAQRGNIQNASHLQKPHGCTKGQKASAVKRKRAAGNPGGKPTNVKTFA